MIDFSEQRKSVKWDDDLERRANALRALDYYRNNQLDYLNDRIALMYPKEHATVQKYATTHGITEALINDMAIVFQAPPTITFEGSDAQVQMLDDLMGSVHFNRLLPQIDRYVELLGKVGLCPRWHAEKGYLILDILTPDRTVVYQDTYDHTRASEVWYHVGEMANTRIGEKTSIYYAWTDTEFREIEVGTSGAIIKTLNTAPNPYGRIPIAWYQRSVEIDDFWPDQGYPIVETNEMVNLRLTNLQLALDYQSFSTLVTTGLPDGQTIPVGVTHRINIPWNAATGELAGGAEYITPQPALTEVWQITQDYIVSTARLNGLSAQSVNRDSASFTSGYQLKLSKQDIVNRNTMKREFYREPTRDLIQLMMDCYTANNNFRFPAPAEISIDFAEITFEANPMEQAQLDAIEMSLGITDRVTLLMDRNPDLTEDDAIARVAAIDARRIKYNIPTPTPIAADNADTL